jgi:tripartite-type tricarboxylate transporter receptor subunit TctC
MKRRTCLATATAIALITLAGNAGAQGYPTKPVRLVIPFVPGGGTDILARMIALKLSESLGQPVIPDNRAAADGLLATELVARAVPDGYTLLIVSSSHAINAALGRKLPYDTLKDFAPITQTASQQLFLVVNPSVPARSVKEFIELAKAKPNALNYGSSSNAVVLPMELFKAMTGTQIVHIPYKGSAPALNDLIGGQIQAMFGASISTLPHVRSGKLRALAIGDSQRSALMPELPTVAEAGVPGYQAVIWSGMLAPAKTPRAIVERLNRDVVRAVQSHDVKDRLVQLGSDPVGSSPDEFGAFIRTEITKWAKVARDAGMKPES